MTLDSPTVAGLASAVDNRLAEELGRLPDAEPAAVAEQEVAQ